MKDQAIQTKTDRQNGTDSRQQAAGPAGASITPPGYGISFLDYSPAHVQRRGVGSPGPKTAEGGYVTSNVETAIEQMRGGGHPLQHEVRAEMENAFGADFSSVRIHSGTEAYKLSQSLDARAFTTGSDIFFDQGEYNSDTASGKHLLAHELAHVVQQNRGTILRKGVERVAVPQVGSLSSLNTGVQAKLTVGTVGDRYEQEADQAAQAYEHWARDQRLHTVGSVSSKTRHERAPVMQHSEAVTGAVQRAPVVDGAPAIKEVPAAMKTDEELAADIMDTQLAILVGWVTALHNFDKVLVSDSDKETKPDFKKVIENFLFDKVVGELINRSNVPGGGDAWALLGKLEDEAKRASKAEESASLRDFVVQHRTAIGQLQQSVLSLKNDFVAAVRITRERMDKAGGKRGTGAISPEAKAYGVQRVTLIETLERMDFRLKISTPVDLFRQLSEEWIRQTTITTSAFGTKAPADVIIRLKSDYTIMDAKIQGTGGQKIAEQLLKDSPSGVDVFKLKVRRRIVVYADNNWPKAILRLDADNRVINEGSFVEGNYGEVHRFLRANGLPPTKKLTGD